MYGRNYGSNSMSLGTERGRRTRREGEQETHETAKGSRYDQESSFTLSLPLLLPLCSHDKAQAVLEAIEMHSLFQTIAKSTESP